MTDASTRLSRKDNYYLGIAESVAAKATCVRRTYGAIIVKNDEVLASGYNGSPRGCINCTDTGCIREQLGVIKGDNYNLCASVHAEMNAMLSASRNEMIGATLYIVGMNVIPELIQEAPYADPSPCLLCHRMIVNSGIARVVGRYYDPETRGTVDKEINMTAKSFMTRLNGFYDKSLSDMEKDANSMIVHIQQQKELGLDTPEIHEAEKKYTDMQARLKNARTVLLERQQLINTAIAEHKSIQDQAALFQELMALAQKYNIPFTTAMQDYNFQPVVEGGTAHGETSNRVD